VFFFVKETKGRSLEEMDILFGTVNAEKRAEDVEKVLHKKYLNEEAEVTASGENRGTSLGLEEVSAVHAK